MANSKISQSTSIIPPDSQETGWQSRLNTLVKVQKHPYKPWYKRWWGKIILIFLILLGLLLIVFIYKTAKLTWQIKTNRVSVDELLMQAGYQNLDPKEWIDLTKGLTPYYLGTSSPKVVIVEYGDFNCKHCRVSYPVIREVVNKNRDIVQYIWRNWPGQEGSELLAQAALCAGEQAGNLGFWVFHDQFLLNQGQYATTSQILDLAKEYGFSDTQLKNCLDTKRTLVYLQKDYIDAIDLGGIDGTPTWFINGYKFTGELPEDFFNYMIQQLTQLDAKK